MFSCLAQSALKDLFLVLASDLENFVDLTFERKVAVTDMLQSYLPNDEFEKQVPPNKLVQAKQTWYELWAVWYAHLRMGKRHNEEIIDKAKKVMNTYSDQLIQ